MNAPLTRPNTYLPMYRCNNHSKLHSPSTAIAMKAAERLKLQQDVEAFFAARSAPVEASQPAPV